jgi:hypothetical protein
MLLTSGGARDEVVSSVVPTSDERVLAESSVAAAFHCDGLKLVGKALKSAPGFKAVSRPNQDLGAPAAGNPGPTAPDRGNGITASDCNLLHLPCHGTRLDAHGSRNET